MMAKNDRDYGHVLQDAETVKLDTLKPVFKEEEM
ncbi:hypothetical protein CAEBREN_23992 [Caenorhabditis brenneri]|uniref:Uncharacterized protein n=1 Tax=Caenorhabditis brenneri TaxID=135651 RepID=G0MU28_CAEBE|nr:hypothetical protein CAEBREN_23992 [Caenorhabditis brenneri]